MSRALGKDGIMAAHIDEQMNESEALDFLDGLGEYGYGKAMEYDEFAGRIRNFIPAFKDLHQRARWFSNEAELTFALRQRVCATELGKSPFQHFDAATMMNFQYPNRLMEDAWCRSNPEECERGHGIDPELKFYPRSSLEVKWSQIAKGGRGVFALERLEAGALLLPDECGHGMFVPPATYKLASEAAETFENASDFWGKDATRISGRMIGFVLISHFVSQIHCVRGISRVTAGAIRTG